METENPIYSSAGLGDTGLHAAEAKAPGVMEQELRSIPASKLDQFIEVHLPDISFRDELREVIDVLCILLKNRCCRESSHPVRTSKVGKVSPSQLELTEMGWERTLRREAAALIPPPQL